MKCRVKIPTAVSTWSCYYPTTQVGFTHLRVELGKKPIRVRPIRVNCDNLVPGRIPDPAP